MDIFCEIDFLLVGSVESVESLSKHLYRTQPSVLAYHLN